MRRVFPLDNLNLSTQFLQLMSEARNYVLGSKIVILRAQKEIWSPDFLEKDSGEGKVILRRYKFEKPTNREGVEAGWETYNR